MDHETWKPEAQRDYEKCREPQWQTKRGPLTATCDSPPPIGEVFIILEEQEKETHRLTELVETLTQRLRPVLLPDGPEPIQTGSGGVRGYGSPLANIVQSNNMRLSEGCRRLDGIIRLLAL